jgi:hypothetical protein
MSIGRDFPDVVRMPDGSLRLVTYAARSRVYQNTNASRHCGCADDMPQFVLPAAGLLGMMRLDGLVVRTKESSLSKRIE